ncbi:MAG: alpha/beta hydrolase [Actinomycetota bacterium]|nr:alpha/beta hydrolase [Actinomycetota bacterium]
MRAPLISPCERVLDVDGPLHVSEWEGDRERTFVCLAGLGGSAASWLPVGAALSARGCVLAPELPGSGRTPRHGRGSALLDHRRVLSRIISEHATGEVILVGNSLGGALALIQAAFEPRSVRALVLTDPALPWARGALPSPLVMAGFGLYLTPGVGEWVVRRRLSAGLAERMVAIGLRLCAADSSSIDPEVVRAHVESVRARQADPDAADAFVSSARSLLELGIRPDLCWRILAALTCPALLLHGAKDRFVPLRFAERAAERQPLLELRVFPDLGHVPQLEAPDRWLRAVEVWLDALPRTRPDGAGVHSGGGGSIDRSYAAG